MPPIDSSLDLLVIMPVYNEQASIEAVLEEWLPALSAEGARFRVLLIDDGSTDATPEVLRALRTRHGGVIEIVRHANRGHGQSCLAGYRAAVARGVAFVLQLDSDGQCDPRYFRALWARRRDCDVVYGRRTRRDDGWRRVLASVVVRVSLWALCRVDCVDANVPYRLMRTNALAPILERVPPDFVLANIALAVLLRRDPAVRHGSVPIRFRARSGGEPSVRLGRFGSKALELHRQLRALPPASGSASAADHPSAAARST